MRARVFVLYITEYTLDDNNVDAAAGYWLLNQRAAEYTVHEL